MSWQDVENYDTPFYIPRCYSDRVHKLCRLPNGILTLLISDPKDTISACSLSVATGSHNDPADLPGLAHLCEHMVLAAGSKDYPNAGLYHSMLTKNNGTQNAFTTGEQTTFYFEVPTTQNSGELIFDKLVDVFSSFFKEPLFNPLLTNKEIYAIQSEHEGNISSLNKILYHATRLMANKDHPFSQFSTGNINTLSSIPQLKKINLKKALLDYFARNFYGSKMTLCVRGPQSVNTLTKLVVSKFGDIRANNGLKRSKFGSISSRLSISSFQSKERQPTDLEQYNILKSTWKPKYREAPCFTHDSDSANMIFIRSNKQSTLRFLFPVEDKFSKFSSKTVSLFKNFWCELFGDETKGSLCYLLVGKSWITDCFAYTSEFSSGSYGLILQFALTNTGWDNVDKIINIVLDNTIAAFIDKPTDQLSCFLKEQNTIDLIRFLYQPTEKSPMEECSNISCLLQEDLEDLDISYLFKGAPTISDCYSNDNNTVDMIEYEQECWLKQAREFQEFLKVFMNRSNVFLFLLGNEKIAHSLRSIIRIRYFLLMQCMSLNILNVIYLRFPKLLSTQYTFQVPPPNAFIPPSCQDVTILQQLFLESSLKSRFSTFRLQLLNTNLGNVPHLISRNSSYEMWALDNPIDASIDKKSIMSFEIFNRSMIPSPENSINLEILSQILSTLISPQLYPSIRLGYSYEISSSPKGDIQLKVTIGGFSEGIISILDTIVKTLLFIMKTPQFPSKELLRRSRVLVRNLYEAAASDNCVTLASMGLLIILERNMWTLQDRLEALEEIDMVSFKEFCVQFLEEPMYMNLLIQGNLDYGEEINNYLNTNLTHHLECSNVKNEKQSSTLSTILLEPGSNFYAKYNGHMDDPNNSIVYFIQTGLRTNRRTVTLTYFTEYIMSLTLVPDLRNKRQIGYAVFGGLRELTSTIGIHITVMSGISPSDLEIKIDEYIAYLEETLLNSLTENQFTLQYKQGYLDLLSNHKFMELEKSGGPADLLNEVVANVQSGNADELNSHFMKSHKHFFNEISNKRYQFKGDSELVDIEVIKNLTKKEFLKFFREKVSIKSKVRSKISVMIESPMAEMEIVNRKTFLQLQAFLKLEGFTINSEILRDIVERANGRPSALIKDLFKYFRERNEALRLCTVILKEVVKVSASSLKHRYTPKVSSSKMKPKRQSSSNWDQDTEPAIPLKEIKDLNEFKGRPSYL
ncbi:Axl1p NDAI_0A04650 [Naumovozyma dairenensis CBS 421]|uniref:Peptidase M16 N-terminal domain-containing protein n=1 Tax=Naumovozyma dairenensis (strain ATCC 10597 / BCRC 20456 / CBS 421 / NBRC 0211 / NRRL Y-12639) TaxID=1071378 RepID=G0W483_NAUDC|nr:hypothetical protein NDAI_0A04650 [Naumovozyma dairenensis CBS 421]CCD22621.1 hypothetical protein NDAI_0A04650 [Naumovozyma dairenensis CBS 421]